MKSPLSALRKVAEIVAAKNYRCAQATKRLNALIRPLRETPMSAHQYLFRPQPTPAVAIDGEGAPVPYTAHFLMSINYAAHAREMGKDPGAEPLLLHQAG